MVQLITFGGTDSVTYFLPPSFTLHELTNRWLYNSGKVCSLVLIKISIFVARTSAEQLEKQQQQQQQQTLTPWLSLTRRKYLVNACKTVDHEKHPLFANHHK